MAKRRKKPVVRQRRRMPAGIAKHITDETAVRYYTWVRMHVMLAPGVDDYFRQYAPEIRAYALSNVLHEDLFGLRTKLREGQHAEMEALRAQYRGREESDAFHDAFRDLYDEHGEQFSELKFAKAPWTLYRGIRLSRPVSRTTAHVGPESFTESFSMACRFANTPVMGHPDLVHPTILFAKPEAWEVLWHWKYLVEPRVGGTPEYFRDRYFSPGDLDVIRRQKEVVLMTAPRDAKPAAEVCGGETRTFFSDD